ncbi:MAG: KpsF/GutQ family sugar-phosphate isomerase [Alphaproteobacteria bacterium]|jgi:arabinose-5-phosphate isomerase|nr:KpsF/GutQ family sugar-phosphate isomerase [Alphaproteobacteria bacterium]
MKNLKHIAEQVINTEIKGLEEIKTKFDDSFRDLVAKILTLKGRVVISGMGKSGHIANKISATLASTGTPAFFIHPAEASHGDLGMITKDDLVILLSNSGETKELGDIINYCKRFKITLVALVRRKSSILVNSADIAIVLPEIEEASNVNAPTTSTTMMLAYGDALAVTLAEIKGFNKENFSIYHPGGKLGSQLLLTEQLMRSSIEIPLCDVDADAETIINKITKFKLGIVGIINHDEKLVGVITDGDIRRNISDNILLKKAQDIMTSEPKTVQEETLAIDSVNSMNKYDITNIFVVNKKEKPIGIINLHDCFKAGLI